MFITIGIFTILVVVVAVVVAVQLLPISMKLCEYIDFHMEMCIDILNVL